MDPDARPQSLEQHVDVALFGPPTAVAGRGPESGHGLRKCQGPFAGMVETIAIPWHLHEGAPQDPADSAISAAVGPRNCEVSTSVGGGVPMKACECSLT